MTAKPRTRTRTRTRTRAPALDRRLLLLLALTCAVAVGNLYFAQALTPLAAAGLGVTPDAAALAVTATQVGYAAGNFLLVPLGDRLPHRRLLATLLGLTGLGLLAAGLAPTLPVLAAASGAAGLTSVAAPVIGPLAAGLVAPDRRGEVSGMLAGGAIGGMLLSRAFGGALAEGLGWRAPYLVAAVVILFLAWVLTRTLPATPPPTAPAGSYLALLAGTLQLLCTEAELRRSGFYQATVFAGFSAVWTGLALLLTGPAYGLGPSAVGLFALVGAATMVCTPLAGRLTDRHGPDPVNLICLLGTLASAPVLAAGTCGGTVGLVALVLGTLLLDVAMQCGMVANTTRVLGLRDDARSRLTTAYMTCAYLGGSAGSWLGAHAWDVAGWPGVCGLLAVCATAALLRHAAVLTGRRQAAR
ncbi:MFS transporter [Streptomyces cavernicola]|uniref:MFS transporter n=1 Tax=Streptomyces cavernicola TaxID=3043613 RepID=A0ABT6S9A8_9ACTN|nr:MFS transporter [Streptomyces sp. B-S-A6]MDI3404697.1 MFS transporter [Streptomyces sp. B-S-A6]